MRLQRYCFIPSRSSPVSVKQEGLWLLCLMICDTLANLQSDDGNGGDYRRHNPVSYDDFGLSDAMTVFERSMKGGLSKKAHTSEFDEVIVLDSGREKFKDDDSTNNEEDDFFANQK